MTAIKLADMMTRHLRHATAAETLAEAIGNMAQARISSLVVMQDKQPVGIVTERDILRAWCQGVSPQRPLADIMSAPVLCASADTEWQAAYHLLALRKIRHLLVTDANGEIAGIVSESDFRQRLGHEFLSRFDTLAPLLHDSLQIGPDTLLRDAMQAMHHRRASCAVVVADDHAVGILTERDVARLFAQQLTADQIPVSAVMTQPVHSIDIDQPLPQAFRRMQELGVRHLVVTHADGLFAGVLGEHDIVAPLEADYLSKLQQRTEAMSVELRETQQRIQAIFDGTAVYLGLLSPDGKLLQANAAALRGVSASMQELAGTLFWETPWVSHDSALQELMRNAVARAAAGETVRFEYQQPRRDGGTACIDFSLRPIYDNGRLIYLLPQGHDVTERRAAEDALRQSEERLRLLTANISDLISRHAPDSRILYVSPVSERFFGYPAQTLEGRLPSALVHPDDQIIFHAFHQQLLLDPEHQTCTYRVRHYQGHYLWVETSARGLRDGNGAVAEIVAVTRNVDQRKRQDQQERIRNRIYELLASDGALGELLEQVVAFVECVDSKQRCSVLLLDDSGHHLITGAAPSLPDFYNQAVHGLAIGEGQGSCGTAAFRGERVIVENIASSPLWHGFTDMAARAGLAACWSEPIRDSAGKILGTFAIYHDQPASPSEEDIALIQQAAMLASIAIERKRSDEALELAASVYQSSSEAIMVTDGDNRIIAVNPAFSALTGYSANEVVGHNPKLLSSGRNSESHYRNMWETLRQTGQWQGEIWNRRKSGDEYVEWLSINTLRDHQGRVHRYIAMFSDITDKKATEDLIWRQANYDTLTHLPNRRLFRDRLQQELKKAEREKLPLALLFIDLDRFKEVNDILGHDAGDELLTVAAQRLVTCVRETDTVARLGGDEFTVILPTLADTKRIESVAQLIVERLAEPYRLGSEVAYVSGSVGITLYPDDAGDLETLLKNADQAMYAAKEQGRRRFSYFTDSMQAAAQHRLQLSNDLRNALKRGEFLTLYQPIVDLASGQIIKAEALLRWKHPQRGLVSPTEFIPLAEEIGLINDIGDWVFRQSVGMAKHWCRHKIDCGECPPTCAGEQPVCPVQISVNKSPRQFYTANTHDTWVDWLREADLPPSCIVIEITEGLLLDDHQEVAAKLLKFRDLGIQVALDDFGTGYSAMSYLKKFHIDYLKIDQSFVRDITTDAGDRAIAEAIIVMGHKLGLQVVAEGIETEEQRALLAAAGCDYGQGFLFARPLPPGDFIELLKKQRQQPA